MRLGKLTATIVAMSLGMAVSAGAAGAPLRFGHLTVEDGLSRDWVQCVLKDSRGFLWVGTQDGLNRYDGTKFTVYSHSPDDPESLPASVVGSLYEDSRKRLWIGTTWGLGGLALYDRDKDRFVRFPHGPGSKGLSGSWVQAILEDGQGRLWVGTDNGLNLVDPDQGVFRSYPFAPGEEHDRTAFVIFRLLEDRRGRLWAGTGSGLFHFDPRSGRFIRWSSRQAHPDGPTRADVWDLLEDDDGKLWVATVGGGLYRLDPESGEEQRFVPRPGDPTSLSHLRVRRLAKDAQGRLWIGTENGGLNVRDPLTGRFTRYLPDFEDEGSLNSASIWALYVDDQDIVWIGTYNGGLNFLSPFGQGFRLIKAKRGGLSNPHVTSILEDRRGDVWIGTDGGGLNRIDGRTGRLTYYRHNPKDPRTIGSDAIFGLFESSDGAIWVGGWDAGLGHLDPDSGSVTRYRHDPSAPTSIISNNVWGIIELRTGELLVTTPNGVELFDRQSRTFKRLSTLYPGVEQHSTFTAVEDAQGNLWLGCRTDGVQYVDRRTGAVKTYRHDPADPHSLGRGWVMDIHIDDAKNVWFGTEGGLTCLPAGSQQMRRYTVEHGLPHDSVTSILEDPSGSLWLGTNRGLSKFVDAVRLPGKPQFLNFDVHDGLQGKEFAPGAAFRTRSGALYFGGQRGLNHFFPDDIQRNPEPPRVVFTDLRIFNKSVKPGTDGSPLERSITETREISLSHRHSVVTFEFAALNYVLPQKNQYEYMLDGIDPGWNRVGTRHTATYTSLPHGRRVFRVRASNNDGVWSTEDAVLSLTVKPRLHQTVYFWVFILIIAAGLSYGAYHLRVATLKARERDLAQRVEESTHGLREERDLRREAQERLHSDLEALHEIAGKVADGDLTLRGEEGDTTLGRIARSVNHMLERFCGILTEVRDAAFSVSSASAEIHSASTQIAKGAQYGRDEVHQTSSAVEEIAASMNQVAKSAENAAEAARQVLEHLRESDRAVDVTAQGMMRIDEAVSQTADKMRLVGQSSERVFETIDFMEEIANRSELLSLNAAIEAAHAGETGRGFSVVAEEIHRLAERSNEATKDVTAIVKGMADETQAALAAMQNSMREVKEGLQLSEQARRGLQEISGLVKRAVDLADQISLATQEQTKASQTVARAMQTISNISEESWAGANETAKAVRDLVALSEHLTQAISRFRVDRPVAEKGALLPPEEGARISTDLTDLLSELSRAATSFSGAATTGEDQGSRPSLTEAQRITAGRLGALARRIAGALTDVGVPRRTDAKSDVTEET